MSFIDILLITMVVQFLVENLNAISRKADSFEMVGDVTVFGMFTVRDSDNCTNGITQVSSVQEAEAIRMAFKRLNDIDYIPGVKIGFKALATCGLPDVALQRAEYIGFRSYNRVNSCDGVHGGPVVGLIGPETSSEAIVVSRLLGGFANSSRLLQIGYSTTAPTLSDKSLYPNFFRVVQSDDWQVKTMIELMLELHWTYIAIFYEDGTYGQEATSNLISSAKERGICVPLTLAVNPTQEANEILDLFSTKLKYLQDQNGNYIGGLIFVGGSKLANLLAMSTTNLVLEQILPVIIFSEGVNGQDTLLREKDSKMTPIAATKGSFILSPFSLNVEEFSNHWKSLFQNLDTLVTESFTNSWLMDIFEDLTGCRPINDSCSPMTEEEIAEKLPQVLYSQYALRAALTMAWTIKQVLVTACPKGGICVNFCNVPGSEFISKTAESNINFRTEFLPFHIQSFSEIELVISFDENNDIHLADGVPAYQVQNFRKCSDMENDKEFCFIKVGSYAGTSFVFDESKARDYTLNGEELKWPDFRKSQCPDFSICTDCTKTESMEDMYYIPGDLYIIAIVPIHDKGLTSLQCGSIRLSGGFEIAEAIIYAISKSIEKNMAIPDANIGVIIVDSCNDNVLTQQKLLSLHRFGLKLETGEYLHINDKIIGYIGGLGSSVSIPVAEISNRLDIVQISYGSTSPVLSDRNSYPYFMRLPSPDNKQAPVILSIVKQMESNLIQLLYSDGAYGEGGRDSILQNVHFFGICVANTMPIVDGPLESYTDIINELRKHSEAKIVVLFLRSHVQPKLLQMLNHQVKSGEFLFIGSEGWGNRDLLKYADNLVGALTIAQVLPLQDGFREHMSQLIPTGSDDNKWLQPYMESRLGCYYEWSFNKLSGMKCSKNARLDASIDYKMDAWTPFAIHATHALLMGAHDALLQLCSTTYTLCDAYRNHTDVVVERIKDIRLDMNNLQIESTVFDENGEGIIDYNIYNVQNDGGRVTYKEVGRWFGDGGFEFRKEKLVLPGGQAFHSTCSNHPVCNICFPPEPEKDDTETILIVLVVILVVALVVVVAILIVLICRRRYFSKEKDNDLYDNIHHTESDYTHLEQWSQPSDSFQASSRYAETSFPRRGVGFPLQINIEDCQTSTSPVNATNTTANFSASKLSSSSSYVDVSNSESNTVTNPPAAYDKALPLQTEQNSETNKRVYMSTNNLENSENTTNSNEDAKSTSSQSSSDSDNRENLDVKQDSGDHITPNV